MCTICVGSYTPPMKSFTIFCDSVLDIKLLLHPLLNSVSMNINFTSQKLAASHK